jgi:hypothetical protein
MDLHQRQQFDFLLQTAAERFVARMEERYRGAQPALEALRADPTATTAALATFVAAIFRDFLLDDADGAAFVLRAVPRRSIAAHRAALADTATVEDLMAALARGLFAELLLTKTLESLEQRAGYEAVQPVPP